MTPMDTPDIAAAKKLLREDGYVVIRKDRIQYVTVQRMSCADLPYANENGFKNGVRRMAEHQLANEIARSPGVTWTETEIEVPAFSATAENFCVGFEWHKHRVLRAEIAVLIPKDVG